MITHVSLLIILCQLSLGYPNQRAIRIPDLQVSSPDEVNSLEKRDVESAVLKYNSVNQNYNVEDVVKEVENLIKSNPSLPRLTRGEILDILDNITRTDVEKAKIINTLRDPKAIMVVMPYTPDKNGNNLEDLYTKKPVTQIIGGEPFKLSEASPKGKTKKPISVTQSSVEGNYGTKKKIRRTQKPKSTTTEVNVIINKSEETSYVSTKVHSRRRPELTTQSSTTVTQRPRNRRPTRRKTTVTPTTPTTTKYVNHRYPDDEKDILKENDKGGIRIIESPKLATTSSNDGDLLIQEDYKEETYFKPTKPTSTEFPKHILKPISSDIIIPDSLRNVVKTMDIDGLINTDPEEVLKKPSTYRPTTGNKDNIQSILAALQGVQPTVPTTTAVPNVENVVDSLSPDMRELLMNFGLLPDSKKKEHTPDLNGYSPEKPEVSLDSYVGFKPLPDDTPARSEMDELLASFGLGRSARKQKAVSHTQDEPTQLKFDVVPDSMKDVLTDIGFVHRGDRKYRNQQETKDLELAPQKQHVFNPVGTKYTSEEQLKKLSKLMEMIKQLEKLNRTITDEDLKEIDLDSLRELIGSLNTEEKLTTLDQLTGGPNPVYFDKGLTKNEVKRQEEKTTIGPTTTESTDPSTSVSITITEDRKPSVSDLEASFGGQTAATEAATLPPPEPEPTRKTGFYYLLDWNTFLDIDDQKGRRVNLRFQPKVGDPRQFLSVSVP